MSFLSSFFFLSELQRNGEDIEMKEGVDTLYRRT